MKRAARMALAIGVCTLLIAAFVLLVAKPGRGPSVYADGDAIRVVKAGAPVRMILWRPATRVPGVIDESGDEYEPRVSADGTTMVFVRGKPGENAELFASRWSASGWSAPTALASVNTTSDELGPELSHDGASLYFYSDREGGLGGYDLWVSRRDGEEWGTPINLGPEVNSPHNEYGPALTPDGKKLYFASNRPRPDEPEPARAAWTATVRESRGRHDYDLFAAPMTSEGAELASAVAELNTTSDEGSPAISPAGDFLYFSSDRAGGSGGFDLYRTRLKDGRRVSVENLGSPINTGDDEMDPALSSDGFRLFFSSNREIATTAETDVGAETTREKVAPPRSKRADARDYSLWGSVSREVYVDLGEPIETNYAELWSDLWPWLLLLLSLIALGYLLSRLLRDAAWRKRFGQLSLLAQCLLISVALHMALAGLLAIWQVGSQIGEYLAKSGGGTRVVLASTGSGSGGDIAGQVRGGLTTAEFSPADVAGMAAPLAMSLTPNVQGVSTDVDSRSAMREAMLRTSEQDVAKESSPATSEPGEVKLTVDAMARDVNAVAPGPIAADAPVNEAASAHAAPPTNLTALAAPVTVASRTDVRRAEIRPASSTQAPERGAALSTDAMDVSSRLSGASTPMVLRELISVPPSNIASGVGTPASEAPAQPASSEASVQIPDATAGMSSGVSRPSVAAPPRRGLVTASDPGMTNVGPHVAQVAGVADAAPSEAPSAGASAPAMSSALSALPAPSRVGPSIPVEAGPIQDSQPVTEPGLAAAGDVSGVPGIRERAPVSTALVGAAHPGVTSTVAGSSSTAARAGSVPALKVGEAGDAPLIGERGGLKADAPSTRFDGLTPSASLAGASGVSLPTDEPRASAASGTSEGSAKEGSVGDMTTQETVMRSSPAPLASGLIGVGPAVKTNVGASSAARQGGGASTALKIDAPGGDLGLPSSDASGSRDARANRSGDAPGLRLDGLVPGASVSAAPSVGIPADEPPVKPVETFPQRAPEVRAEVLEKMGGSEQTEKAVGLALNWFLAHQEKDGRWTGRRFDDACGKCGSPAEFDSDAAMTGIVLLCFLGAGHTHIEDGPYRENVTKAMNWLIARQAANGDLRRGETMYSQTVATVALCEALAMTGDQKLAGPTRRAVAFLEANALRRDNARRDSKETSDNTLVLGWQVMAVASARRAGITVSGTMFDAARQWLDYVSDSRRPGRYSYRRGEQASAAMTAEAMFVRQLLGNSRDEAAMKESAAFVLKTPPKWSGAGGASTYYWYYATLALFEHQGDAWKQWNEALVPELLNNQHAEGAKAGSWDPQDQWSKMGGRLYQTAICTLSLEVYYRYKPAGD